MTYVFYIFRDPLFFLGTVIANKSAQPGDKRLKAGLLGSVLTAICCFTPVLVIGLGFVGLAFLKPYLDYVLLPLSGVFLVLAFYGWSRRERESG